MSNEKKPAPAPLDVNAAFELAELESAVNVYEGGEPTPGTEVFSKVAAALNAPIALNRRQRRCIRNAAQRFDHIGYAIADELRACFPEAFEQRGKGRM